jgi:hypothetical protein
MSKATHSMEARSTLLARSLQMQWTLRLVLGYIVLLGSMIFLLGTGWDIQWHALIGRDRTLIPPHVMMLSGVVLSGAAALLATITETALAHRHPVVRKNGIQFANMFHGSLGAYIAGYAALNAAIAFPLDSYWHSLYGIDVAIWAPFHMMFFVGMVIVALGATFMLISAAKFARESRVYAGECIGYIGGIVGAGTILGLVTTLLFDPLSNSDMLIRLGSMSINVFFFLSGFAVAWIIVSIAIALPWRWTATYSMIVYLLVAFAIARFVPPATVALVTAEHQTFRVASPGIALVAFEWPLAPLLGAIVIDLLFQRGRRRNWSLKRRFFTIASLTLIGSIPITISHPLLISTLFESLGPANLLVSLLLGLCGSWLGTWFGLHMGASMHQGEGVSYA